MHKSQQETRKLRRMTYSSVLLHRLIIGVLGAGVLFGRHNDVGRGGGGEEGGGRLGAFTWLASMDTHPSAIRIEKLVN